MTRDNGKRGSRAFDPRLRGDRREISVSLHYVEGAEYEILLNGGRGGTTEMHCDKGRFLSAGRGKGRGRNSLQS